MQDLHKTLRLIHEAAQESGSTPNYVSIHFDTPEDRDKWITTFVGMVIPELSGEPVRQRKGLFVSTDFSVTAVVGNPIMGIHPMAWDDNGQPRALTPEELEPVTGTRPTRREQAAKK